MSVSVEEVAVSSMKELVDISVLCCYEWEGEKSKSADHGVFIFQVYLFEISS